MGVLEERRVTGSDGAVHSGTKFAVHAISEALRRELHGEGIRVMIVSPGWVNTELGQNMADKGTGRTCSGGRTRSARPQGGGAPDLLRPRPTAARHAA